MTWTPDKPIRLGLTERGWYDGEIINIETVRIQGGTETKLRFTVLLDSGHLAFFHCNISHDPNSKLAQLWTNLTGQDCSVMTLSELIGKPCRVFVEPQGNTNRITTIERL